MESAVAQSPRERYVPARQPPREGLRRRAGRRASGAPHGLERRSSSGCGYSTLGVGRLGGHGVKTNGFTRRSDVGRVSRGRERTERRTNRAHEQARVHTGKSRGGEGSHSSRRRDVYPFAPKRSFVHRERAGRSAGGLAPVVRGRDRRRRRASTIRAKASVVDWSAGCSPFRTIPPTPFDRPTPGRR